MRPPVAQLDHRSNPCPAIVPNAVSASPTERSRCRVSESDNGCPSLTFDRSTTLGLSASSGKVHQRANGEVVGHVGLDDNVAGMSEGGSKRTSGSGNLVRRLYTTAILASRGRQEARVPFRSERWIHKRQQRNLERVVAHALRTVPFYGQAMQAGGLTRRDIGSCEGLSQLPLIDGTTLQQDPLAFVSTAVPLERLVKLYSTGTAVYGAKTVYWRPQDMMSQIAHGERDRSILRHLLGRSSRLVRLSFFHQDSSTAMVSRFHAARLFVPRAAMETHWASCELPFDQIAKRFEEIRPDVAYSYGSFAEAFLLHVRDNGWSVPLPKVWVFGGDGMSPESRRRIEEDLGCILYSTYQAVEAGRIGFECEERSGFHINVDLCHVRLVNDQGQTVAPGETGEVVLSSLLNRATVLLNYKLGDQAAWRTDPCPCGRRLPVLHLTGARTGSTLRLRDGRELPEHAILHACKESMHDVLQFQIVEHAPESITWRVAVSHAADRTAIAEDLVARSRSVMSSEAKIDVEFEDRLLPSRYGKLTRIVRASEDSTDNCSSG